MIRHPTAGGLHSSGGGLLSSEQNKRDRNDRSALALTRAGEGEGGGRWGSGGFPMGAGRGAQW